MNDDQPTGGDSASRATRLPKRVGRPSKLDGPAFPADQVEALLVHGDVRARQTADGEHKEHYFPSYREIADRFGVAHSLIAAFAKRHNCMERRKRVAVEARALSDEQAIEQRAAAITRSKAEVLQSCDLWCFRYDQALREGRVRTDSTSDFNTIVRLKLLLEGHVESRQEVVSGVPTLEQMQEYYRWRQEEDAGLTPQNTGLILVEPEDKEDGDHARDDEAAGRDGVADPPAAQTDEEPEEPQGYSD